MYYYTATLEESITGELILPISEDFCKNLGWYIGDTLKFSIVDEVCTITNISWQKDKRIRLRSHK